MTIENALIESAIPAGCAYQTLLRAIGEGMRDLYGSSWEQAEAASRELWPTYARTTGLSWADVRKDIRLVWEAAPTH